MPRTRKQLQPLDSAVQEILARAVRQSGRTHAAIGEEVGLSQNRVSTILRGDTPPATIGELTVLSGALGLRASDVLREAESELDNGPTRSEAEA